MRTLSLSAVLAKSLGIRGSHCFLTISPPEEYFLIAISFMLVNLLGHAAAFHLDAKGRHHTQKIVNKFSLWGMLSVFVAVVLARLHVPVS